MNRILSLKAGLVLCAVVVSVAALWPNASAPEKNKQTPVITESHKAATTAAPTRSEKPLGLPGITQKQEMLDFDPEMKQRLLTISEAYENHIAFPSFSRPIDEEELERKYLPDIPIANELPARLDDPASPMLSIKPSKMRYFPGDDISATAVIKGLPAEAVSQVIGSLKANGKEVAHAIVSPLADIEHGYHLQFQSLDHSDFDAQQELVISTEFQFGGQRYQRGTSVEYATTIARIDQVAPASVEAEYLLIPVYVSTEKPGYHRLRGNLYEASSQAPLVHLRDEAELHGQFGTLTLKAHIAALKAAGSEGPYLLKDLSLQRLPSEPDYITEFGSVELDDIYIDRFSFSEYEDQPYINEKALHIAKELRRLGS